MRWRPALTEVAIGHSISLPSERLLPKWIHTCSLHLRRNCVQSEARPGMAYADKDDLWRKFPKTAPEFEKRFATEVDCRA
jgi:hypothetical protein